MYNLIFAVALILLFPSSSFADQDKGSALAQAGGPTMSQSPSTQCPPNENKEWKQTQVCGTNDAGVWIGGEYKCWSYYESSSKSCKRTCTWTGKCDEP
jgi:hypothetical protein